MQGFPTYDPQSTTRPWPIHNEAGVNCGLVRVHSPIHTSIHSAFHMTGGSLCPPLTQMKLCAHAHLPLAHNHPLFSPSPLCQTTNPERPENTAFNASIFLFLLANNLKACLNSQTLQFSQISSDFILKAEMILLQPTSLCLMTVASK